MMRTALVLAAVLAPAAAHAEFRVQRAEEVRPATKRAIVKPAPVVKTVEQPQARLSIDDMLGKINGVYMNGLRRCYTKALMQDPSIAGKVTLTFTVDAGGRINADVASASDVVNKCVSMQARWWRFEIPENTQVPTEETFRLSLILASN